MTARIALPPLVNRIIKLIWFLPLFWLIGGERLLLPVALILATYKHALPLRSLPRPLVYLFFFLVAYLISIVALDSGARYITFVWDFAIYLSMFFIVLALARQRLSFKEAEILIKHVVIFVFAANLLAFTYFVFGGWSFSTPLGFILPGSIKSGAIGSKIATHGVGRELYFAGLTTRLASFFVSSMQYAAVILISLPATYYFISAAKGGKKLIYIIPFVCLLIAGLFAQGRTAIVLGVLALAFMVPLMAISKTRIWGKGVFNAVILGILGVALIGLVLSFSYLSAEFQTYFVDARASSASERFEVYTRSGEAFTESPIIGHGSQVDEEDLAIPLGSHNWYLGVLFKHGLLGFLPFVAFLLSVLIASYKLAFVRGRATDKNARAFGFMLLTTVGSHCALCITAEPVVDAIHIFIISIYYGVIISMSRSVGLSAQINKFERPVVLASTRG